MAAVLNSNVASMWASKNLQGAQNKMAASVERLSSGLRINHAKDDAAGLGIAHALTSQINGANQGVRNLNDGISMVQTTEGAIAAAQEMAQRILTLATQGANGTMSTTDRTAIKSEMSQLLTAINGITGRTKFSGNSLLSFDAKATAVDAKFSLQVSNQTTDTISLSSNAFKNIGGSTATTSTTGVTTIAATAAASGTPTTGTTVFTLSAGADESLVAGTKVYRWRTGGSGLVGTYTEIGTVASATSGSVTLAAATTTDVIAATDKLIFGSSSGLMTNELSATAGDLSLAQAVASSTNDTSDFQMVQRAATGYITALSTQRSLLGAYQNQIDFTVSNVNELSSNLSAARSNVQDTDYASETASLTKGQILQQAATAMLAQANQMPNVILSLLK
jgi:flagellin